MFMNIGLRLSRLEFFIKMAGLPNSDVIRCVSYATWKLVAAESLAIFPDSFGALNHYYY